MINETDILKFYDFLRHKHETEIRIIKPGTKEVISFFVHNAKEFLEVCREYNGKYNIYVGINERSLSGKEDADVLAITNIGHDVDCHGDISKLPIAKEILNEYVEVTKNTGLNEPLLFCSGRGYWILHHVSPIEPTAENKSKIKLWASSIKRMFEKPGVEFDSTVYNFSRIARVPGTLNISDPNNYALSYIVNSPGKEEDKLFSEKILEIKLPEYKDVLVSDIPKGSCAFMDYCLKNKLPVGEIHHIIARNFSVYVHARQDRKILVDAFNERFGGANINCWLESIDKNPERSYPFSCGQLIKYQYKNNIPLQCLECPLYKKQNQDAEPRGWACSININKLAERHSFTKCHVCNNDFEFNEKLGFYRCNTCKYQGGLKKFVELIVNQK
jgi:hypothetical protein